MSQIYRYELFSVGMDFSDGFGFSICQTGIHQWFDVPSGTRYIDFLVSTEKFDESIPARAFSESTTDWLLTTLDRTSEVVAFYERTSNFLKEVSRRKIYIGVEY